MIANLLYPDRGLAVSLELAWNEPDLLGDLGLGDILNAMAAEPGETAPDRRILDTGAAVLRHAGGTAPGVILYRQQALRDAFANPAAVRELYQLAGDAVRDAQGLWLGALAPRTVSGLLYLHGGQLRRALDKLDGLRTLAERYRAGFHSEAFQKLFDACRAELQPDYLATVRGCLDMLEFRQGVLAAAQLGEFNESRELELRTVPPRPGWAERLRGGHPPRLTITLHESDETGARIVGEMRARATGRVAAGLMQAAQQVLGFFQQLHIELAFYAGALRLRQRLRAQGLPVCFPGPAAVGRGLQAAGLYDVALALHLPGPPVGNDIRADDKDLIVITGANRGGKSTLLRSLGQAQLMMQAGLFVGADAYAATLCPLVATHFRREEDPRRMRGKFEEELQRLSAIVDHLAPGAWLLLNESFAATQEREAGEIAGQVLAALRERGMRIAFVTHLASLAAGLYRRRDAGMLFLRANREPDGSRSYRLSEGEPLATSFGEDLYRRIFPAAGDAAHVLREANPGVR